MTEAPARHRRRPGPFAVVWGSIALFAVLLAVLSYRLVAGQDPALGAAGAATSPRPVLIRKVVKHRIVTTVLPRAGASGALEGSSASSAAEAAAPEGELASPEPEPEPLVTGAS